jgi:LysM repeat protein
VEQVRQPQRRIFHSNSNTATVRSGDTISGIAARTGLWPVSAWSVPSGNVNLIYPGNVVTYRGAGSGNGSTTAVHMHIVRSGETLSGIFGASGWQRVAQLNGLTNPNLIYPGQQLRY